MTLFQPDTKAKNLFLSKLSILVDKPILFDLYRFGTNFEFKYGKVFMHKIHFKFLFFSIILQNLKRLYPTFTNWLPDEPKNQRCVQMASRKSRHFSEKTDWQVESSIQTGWETVDCDSASLFLCADQLFPDSFFDIE